MNDAPNSNVKLTFDQLQAIDTTEKRLANLQTEVSVAVSNLTAARLDAERVTKERIYQDDLLKSVTEKVKELQARHDVLLSNIQTGNAILSDNAAKAAAITAESEAKLVELDNKETALNVAIKEHEANVKAHEVKSKQLDVDYDTVKKAADILKIAVQNTGL